MEFQMQRAHRCARAAEVLVGRTFFGSVSFFAYIDVGKGREQDAEAFAERNELAIRRN